MRAGLYGRGGGARVDDVEDRERGADAECERRDRGGGEDRVAAEDADAVAQILNEVHEDLRALFALSTASRAVHELALDRRDGTKAFFGAAAGVRGVDTLLDRSRRVHGWELDIAVRFSRGEAGRSCATVWSCGLPRGAQP